MITGPFRVTRWRCDDNPHKPGYCSVSLELRSHDGHISIGLDMLEADARRLEVLAKAGTVDAQEVFSGGEK